MGFPYIPVLIASAASAAAGSAVTYYIATRKSGSEEPLSDAMLDAGSAVQAIAGKVETAAAETVEETGKVVEKVKEAPPKTKGKKKK